MYSNKDFERLFIRYKVESVPKGESIQQFCHRNEVPYNLFEKWYKDTRHRVVPVQVEGAPSSIEEVPAAEVHPSASDTIRIKVDIKVSNGLHIQQCNLSYAALLKLVEKLEVLC